MTGRGRVTVAVQWVRFITHRDFMVHKELRKSESGPLQSTQHTHGDEERATAESEDEGGMVTEGTVGYCLLLGITADRCGVVL